MRAAFVVLAACGRIGFDARDVAVDASVGTGPWGTPTLAFVGEPLRDYDDPSMTSDGLELYVNDSNSMGTAHVAVLRRDAIGDPWGPPARVVEITGSVTQPALGGDRVMYMYATAMLVSTRDASLVWSTPVPVPDLDGPGVFDVSAGPGGHEAVVTHDDPALEDDLALVRRSGTQDPWGSREPITAVNLSGVSDAEGCIAEYGDALYFGSSRDDPNRDIYRAVRSGIGQPFGPAERILELSSASEDSDPWVSMDGHTIFFTSQRGGSRQIWTATR